MSEAIKPEIWSNETISEFLVNNSLTPQGYSWAIQEIVAMGVDPTLLNADHLDQSEPWVRPELYVKQNLAYKKL